MGTPFEWPRCHRLFRPLSSTSSARIGMYSRFDQGRLTPVKYGGETNGDVARADVRGKLRDARSGDSLIQQEKPPLTPKLG